MIKWMEKAKMRMNRQSLKCNSNCSPKPNNKRTESLQLVKWLNMMIKKMSMRLISKFNK